MDRIKNILSKKVLIVFISLIVFLICSLFLYKSYYMKDDKIEENTFNLEVEEKESGLEEVINYITIDIKGEVNNPGVYVLEEGKRVQDAIRDAGGLTKKAITKYINLSKILEDEDVIIIDNSSDIKKIEEVKNIEEIKINNNTSVSVKEDKVITNNKNDIIKSEEVNTLVNINTCSKEDLLKVNGIGESKADAIIEYRNSVGKFNTKEDIKNVSGIGEALYAKIEKYITT